MHAISICKRLQADIFPLLGSKPINEIKAPELLAVLRLIEARGAIDIAHRALQTCGQIFRYAIATGKAERDISADLRGALKTRKKENYSHLNPSWYATKLKVNKHKACREHGAHHQALQI